MIEIRNLIRKRAVKTGATTADNRPIFYDEEYSTLQYRVHEVDRISDLGGAYMRWSEWIDVPEVRDET